MRNRPQRLRLFKMTRYFWDHFPAEIRLMILEHLAEAEYHKRASLVNYTTVSKDWQLVFERVTFCEIYVESYDFDEFQRVFRGVRREFIRYVGLKLRFAAHTRIHSRVLHGTKEEIALTQMLHIARHGPDAHRLLPPLKPYQQTQNIQLTNTLYAFLHHLSRWSREEAYRDGVALEIIAS